MTHPSSPAFEHDVQGAVRGSYAARGRVYVGAVCWLAVYAAARTDDLVRLADGHIPVLPLLSTLAELYLAFTCVQLASLLRSPGRPSSANVARMSATDRGAPPVEALTSARVLLLIPTCGEPLDVVEVAVVGAVGQCHPHLQVMVLDDRARPDIEALATRYGAGYFARRKWAHAKAGNLNAGFEEAVRRGAEPEFIAVADADFYLSHEFVDRALAPMCAADVGLVQTPQAFYNLDPMQRAFPATDAIPDSFRMTHDTVSVAQNAAGGAMCRGTSFVIRVKALRDIGMFPTASVTEDFLTTMRLREHGWRSIYVNQNLSVGLAAETMHEYLNQVHRIALGLAQIARSSLQEPRSWWKRIQAMEKLIRWPLTSVAGVVLLFVPAVHLVTGRPVFSRGFGDAVALFAATGFVGLRAYVQWVSDGRHLTFFREANTLITFPGVFAGLIRGLLGPRSQQFVVTKKGLVRQGGSSALLASLHGAALMAVTIGSAMVWWRTRRAADLVMAGWSLYSLVVGVIALLTWRELPAGAGPMDAAEELREALRRHATVDLAARRLTIEAAAGAAIAGIRAKGRLVDSLCAVGKRLLVRGGGLQQRSAAS